MPEVPSACTKRDLIFLRETLQRLAQETAAAELGVMERIRNIELLIMKDSEMDDRARELTNREKTQNIPVESSESFYRK